MVAIYYSFTTPVNPSGVTPVLTVDQLWEALKVKSRNPTPFVSAIGSCDILSEDKTSLVRKVTFKQGFGPTSETEHVVFSAPYVAEFTMQSNGSKIQNIISHGSGGPSDLYLTFTFNFQRPDLVEGSKEAEEFGTRMKTGTPVIHTVEVAREMVSRGEIQ